MIIPEDPNALEQFIFREDRDSFFPQDTTFSLPVLTKRGDRVFQATFLYQNQPDQRRTIARPFAWSLFPLDNSPVHSFSWCAAQDFVNTSEHPLSSRVSSFLPGGELAPEQLREFRLELEELFEDMITFPLHPELSEFERDVIGRYKDLFLLLCPQGLYLYYQAIAPDFFEWIGLVLVEDTEQAAPASDRNENDLIVLLRTLTEEFRQKIAVDEHKEKLFDEIHNELQLYKAGAYSEIVFSMARDVILVIDDIQKTVSTLEKEAPTPAGYQRLLSLFRGVEEDLTDLLYRQGVDPYSVEGEEIDLPRQKVLATESTNQPELDKTVAERLTMGWAKAGQVIRPEYIKAYLYEADPALDHTKELISDDQ